MGLEILCFCCYVEAKKYNYAYKYKVFLHVLQLEDSLL